MAQRPPIVVRSEQAADIEGIRAVELAAFPTPAEAGLVDDLRVEATFDPSLSLVAERARRVVGHALLTAVRLVDDGGREVDGARILALAPVAVSPADQRRGIGSALCRAAIRAAADHGAPVIVVLGHPAYYPRFGFEPARPLGILPPEDWSEAAWMALRLPGWTPALRGIVRFPPAFDEV